jgi:hypothetical protein
MADHKRKRRPYDVLIIIWAAGLTITLFATAFFQSWDKFVRLFTVDRSHFFLSSSLAVTTFALFLVYIIASLHELTLLTDYLQESDTPRIMPKTYVVAFCLAIFYGVLLAVSDKILIFSAAIVTYNLLDLWGSWQIMQTLSPIIEKRLNSELESEERTAIETIHKFYFTNPWLPRIVTIMFVNWIAVSLSLCFYFTKNDAFRNIAYIVIMLNIIGGEIAIHYWRIKSIYRLKS